jgi:hypothetical protein
LVVKKAFKLEALEFTYFLECAGRTALFPGLRAGPHSGWRDVSRLRKSATCHRTPKACVSVMNVNLTIRVFSIMDPFVSTL